MWKRSQSWFFCLSIRVQLLLLLLLVMVPFIGIVLNSAFSKRAEQIRASRTDLWELANVISNNQRGIELSVQQTGNVLAKILVGKQNSGSRLQQTLIDFVKINPSCSGIAVSDRSGRVIASYPKNNKLQSIAKRRSFRTAKATRLFSSGEYVSEQTSATTFFSFAYPLLATNGDFNGVIEIEIDSKSFLNLLKDSHLSRSSNVTVIDHNGVILYSHLYPQFVGKQDRYDRFALMQKGNDIGDFFTQPGNDGVARLACYRKAHLEHEETPYLFMRVSKAVDSVGARANRELLLYSLTLGLISLTAFIFTGFIGKHLIADRVKELEAMAMRLAAGDLDTRTAGRIAGGELGRLAGAFNQMAEQLADREKRHEVMLDESRFNESKFESLYVLSQMVHESEQAIKDFCLDEAVRTTGSAIGYIYFVNKDESALTLHAWSRGVMETCRVVDWKTEYKVSETGLWGEAVRQRKPVITNDYLASHAMKKGCPQGHVPIERHMNIPLIIDGKIVLLAGVGNKDSDYGENDIRMLTLIMDGMWKLLDKKNDLEKHLENEQFLATLINANLESNYLLNREGTVVIANEVFANRVEVNYTDVVGQNVFDLFQMGKASYRQQQFEMAITLGKYITFEDTRNGMDFLHSVNPVLDQHGSVSHLAIHSMDITMLKAFEKELIATNLKLQALNQKIEDAREEERRTIARELHDQMGQALTGLSLDLTWLTSQLDRDMTLKLDSEIINIHINVETMIAMLQNITARLSPPLLDNLGLTAAIGYYVKDLERKSGIVCHLMLDEGTDSCLSKEEAMSVFRIMQESLTNVIRHAAAVEVAVSLCLTPQYTVLEVADDGKGLTDGDINSPAAFGVLGMQERAKSCGGVLAIVGNPGGGTIVRLEIPLRTGETADESIGS